VLGVLIVLIISGMFILGLENSKIFSVLMITGVLSISGLLAVVTYLRGSIETPLHDNLFPKGLSGVRLMMCNYRCHLLMNLHLFSNPFQQILSATALLVISFPNNLPVAGGRHTKMKAFAFSSVVLISIGLISGCLSTLMPMR
jgi:hypothetical protein